MLIFGKVGLSEYREKSHNFTNLIFYDVTPLVLYWPQKKSVFQKPGLAGRASHFESEILIFSQKV